MENDSRGGLTELEYYTTPEIAMPENFALNEINYRGSLAWFLPYIIFLAVVN